MGHSAPNYSFPSSQDFCLLTGEFPGLLPSLAVSGSFNIRLSKNSARGCIFIWRSRFLVPRIARLKNRVEIGRLPAGGFIFISLWNSRSTSPSALRSVVENQRTLVNKNSWLNQNGTSRHKGFNVFCERNEYMDLQSRSVPVPLKGVPMLALCSPQKSLFFARDFVPKRSF
jgi:hypothetical protein